MFIIIVEYTRGLNKIMTIIDFEGLKQKIKILDLVGGLKKVASTGGGEYAGPCPICGGTDRFRVQPSANIWLCRHCTGGVWRDAVDFIAMRDNISLAAAAREIAGGSLPTVTREAREAGKVNKYHAYKPPGESWEANARDIIAICEGNLYSDLGARALAYLHKRGLTDQTIKAFRLGYSPGAELAGVWVSHGVTIPAIINGKVWYIKIRTNKKDPKYLLVKGSKPAALFNGDNLINKPFALIVEGEFNAMIAYQETQDINDICGIASMGAAGNRPDLVSWGPYFILRDLILALYDDDQAGESGAVALFETLGDRVKFTTLPAEGDINDWHLAGGDIRHWLANEINFHKNTIREVIA
jgi:DNA primase